MSAFAAVMRAKGRIARHTIASIRNESRLKVAVVSISAVLLWVGAFAAFREGFLWLRRFDLVRWEVYMGIGEIVMLRMLSVFSLALFLLLIFSNVFIAFSTLYRSREVSFLLQAPVEYREFFFARFIECVAFSSWASAYLGSPLVLAYGLTANAPWAFYAAAAVFYVPFVVIPAAIGTLATIVLVRIYPVLPAKTIPAAGAALAAGFFFYARGILNAARLAEDTVLAGTGFDVLFSISAQTQSPWLPSHWAAHGLILVSTGRLRESLFYLLLLSANAMMLTWLVSEAAQRMFYPGWSWIAGRDRTRVRPLDRGPLNRVERFLRRLPEPARALAVKDFKLFWRDPTQWTQFTVFFGIMAVYAATLQNRSVPEYTHYRTWIACMNIGAATLILATLTSRFIFPLVSLEGRRFWIVGLAPVTLRQLLAQKFWLSVATTSAFTVGLVVLSCLRLRVEPAAFFLAVYSIVAANFGLAGMAVGLGSLYPNFQEDNPARIVSGMGGTLNFLLSIAYITLIVGAQTLILQRRALGLFLHPAPFWWAFGAVIVIITVLSVVCAIAPMRLGLRHLSQSEY